MGSIIKSVVPGRICLVGEHCDYAQGRSVALPLQHEQITAYAERRDDRIVSLVSALEDRAFRLSFSLDDIPTSEEHPLRYASAVVQAMYSKHPDIQGMNITMDSTLPIKKGLASSAAVSVSIAEIFNHFFSPRLSPRDLAAIAYEAEHDILGIGCGRMDQLAVAYKSLIHLDYQHQQSAVVTLLPSSPDPMHILVGIPLTTSRAIHVMLSAANSAYFHPRNEHDFVFKRALDHRIPQEVVLPFVNAVQKGDKELAGKLLRHNQQIYNECFVPICESFRAPLLNTFFEIAQRNGSLGEKWTGAGGNGAFICLTDSSSARDALQDALREESSLDIQFLHATL